MLLQLRPLLHLGQVVTFVPSTGCTVGKRTWPVAIILFGLNFDKATSKPNIQ